MHSIVRVGFVVLAVLSGCLRSGSVECANGVVCPEGTKCDVTHGRCVTTAQLDACADKAHGAPCSYPGVPTAECREGVCVSVSCGDGAVDAEELCDDANSMSGDGCSADCQSLESCGNGIVDPARGEQCDDANLTSGDTCQADCKVPRCGDGVIDLGPGELCDDGAANANTPNAPCRTNCQPSRCGDGIFDPGLGEVCDDANVRSGDGCAADCQSTETCGNGTIDAAKGEECDDGNTTPADTCQANCKVPRCGDGIVDTGRGEACDEGPLNSNDPDATCRVYCLPRRCGDGVEDPGYGEICDDGNGVAADGCTPDCKSMETCGNGYLDFLVNEQCDDGNRLNHDGCAWTCAIEQPQWHNRTPAIPAARSFAGMTYDSARGRVIMFGGDTGAGEAWEWTGLSWIQITPPTSPAGRARGVFAYDGARGRTIYFDGGTWSWDGTGWTQLFPSATPPAGDAPVMVYDAGRQRIVMFGGSNSNTSTWEWDGSDWNENAIAGPSPRYAHAMAYDPKRARVVLFGGFYYDGIDGFLYNDTWEYDGTEWTQITVGAPPLHRQYATLTWDASRAALVLISGRNMVGQQLGDRWEWNGATWSNISIPATLAARFEHTAIYDPRRQKLVVFGGATKNPSTGVVTKLNDTWECTNTTCTQITPATPPPGRFAANMAYDEARGRVVLFGGKLSVISSGYLADTWEWDGSDWRQITPSGSSPSGRYTHAMAGDPKHGGVLVVSGYSGSLNSDTWSWNGTAWSQRSPGPPPSARQNAALGFSPANDGVLLFGGSNFTTGPLGDTWIWNGSMWQSTAPGNAPSPRAGARCVADRARGRVVLFGADTGTWEWNGTTWADVTPQVSPPSRLNPGLAWDVRRKGMILFGGWSGGDLGDTWEWREVCAGATCSFRWTKLDVSISPPGRDPSGMAYAAATSEVVMYGGTLPENSSASRDDTWVLRYQAGGIRETCRYGFDTDGDSLVGCADPDCWGVCTPMCLPGQTCDPAAPRCGDNSCSQLEDCRLCPSDCGACPVVCGDLLCESPESSVTCAGDCPP